MLMEAEMERENNLAYKSGAGKTLFNHSAERRGVCEEKWAIQLIDVLWVSPGGGEEADAPVYPNISHEHNQRGLASCQECHLLRMQRLGHLNTLILRNGWAANGTHVEIN